MGELPQPFATNRKAGDASWLTTLNQLRSSSSLSAQLPPLVDPSNTGAAIRAHR